MSGRNQTPDDIRTFDDIRRVPKVEKAMMQRHSAQRALSLRRCSLRAPGGGYRISPDQRHHRPAGLSARHLAGLGVVVRMLGLHSLGPGVPARGSRVYPLWIQYFCRFLGRALRRRKDRLRSGSRRRAGHPGPDFENPGIAGHGHDGNPHLCAGHGGNGPKPEWASIRPNFASTKSPAPASRAPVFPAPRSGWRDAWGAKVYDHAGATEIGAWSYECAGSTRRACTSTKPVSWSRSKISKPVSHHRGAGPTGKNDHHGPGPLWPSPVSVSMPRMSSSGLRDPCPCGRIFPLDQGRGRRAERTISPKSKGYYWPHRPSKRWCAAIDGLGDEYEVIVDKKGDIDRINLKVELLTGAVRPED